MSFKFNINNLANTNIFVHLVINNTLINFDKPKLIVKTIKSKIYSYNYCTLLINAITKIMG